MLFDVPIHANWKKIGEYRQTQTHRNTEQENNAHVNWDYQTGNKVLLKKMVYTTNLKAAMKVIFGQSRHFI